MSIFVTESGAILSVHPLYTPKTECDGCGSGWNQPLVPDTIYGLSIRPACCPHDFRYELGGTQEDKDIADRELLDNILSIINNHKKWYYPHWMARHRAMTYYDAVVRAGGSSFNFREAKDEVCDVVGNNPDVPRMQLRRAKGNVRRRKSRL